MVGPTIGNYYAIGTSYDLTIPGDPASMRAGAHTLRELASALRKVHEHQTEDAATPATTLGGRTGRAFRKGAQDVAAPIAALRTACLTGATALDQLARDMYTLKGMVDQLREVDAEAALHFVSGNTLATTTSATLGPPEWNTVFQLYLKAAAYQAGAQAAFVDAIKGDYSSVDSDTVVEPLTPGGYTPTPPQHHPHHQHHHQHHPARDPGSSAPAADGTDGPGGPDGPGGTGGTHGTGGAGDTGSTPASAGSTPHGHHGGQPESHRDGRHHGERFVAAMTDAAQQQDLHGQLSPHQQAELEHRLETLQKQSASLAHRIDVMQQAIQADPTNVDNPLLQQESSYLQAQLDQHQTRIGHLRDQLGTPTDHPIGAPTPTPTAQPLPGDPGPHLQWQATPPTR